MPLVVATSVAAGMHNALFGRGPLFTVPAHDYAGLGALPAFVLLGLACGLLAVVVTQGPLPRRGRLPPAAVRRVLASRSIGALGFATVGLLVPRALGVGYDAIGDVLNGEARGRRLVAVLGSPSWSPGGSRSARAPRAARSRRLLLIGGSFGTLVGTGLTLCCPASDVSPGAFALVAMAATFGASTRATFTAIVFVFELTRDYEVVMPVMLATVLADLVFNSLCAQT